MKVAGRSPNASRVTSDYIIDDGTFPLEEPLCDSDEKSAENKSFSGKDPHGSQIVVLRIAGTICVLFGLIEIGIGSYLFKEFSNAQAGAWWSVLLPTVAGALALISTTRLRVSIILLFAAVGALVAIIGAATDGATSSQVRSLTTCGTQSSPDSRPSFYGISEDVPNAIICMTKNPTKRIYSDAVCYCTGQQGTFCGVYTLSGSSVFPGTNCGYILSRYAPGLIASSTFCALSAVAALALASISAIAVFFPSRRLKLKSDRTGRKNQETAILPEFPEFGISSSSFTHEEINYH